MRKRFGVVRKSAAAAALTLFVVAQPQMLCALHCMVFDHIGQMDGVAVLHTPTRPAGMSGNAVALTAHEHHPVAMPCAHGMNVITAPTLPVAGVGLAIVAPVRQPIFGVRPSTAAPSGAETVIVAYTPRVDPPPPRA